ncbi:kinase-like domain-containing protein [Lactifluus volemus]|nr:kinase-like domain-containing protein [Lactifluus volemus]
MSDSHSPNSASTLIDPVTPVENKTCPGCHLTVLDENGGVVVAFGQSFFHVGCFKCAKCRDMVTADTNLLLLSDGQPVCSTCSYSCSLPFWTKPSLLATTVTTPIASNVVLVTTVSTSLYSPRQVKMTMAPLDEIDDRVREAHQQRESAQLDDLTVRSLEELQTNSRSMSPAEQQWTEPLSPAEAGHGNQPSSQPTIPPRPKPIDLTGKVSTISQQPDIKGSLLEFYLGEWEIDEEQHFKEWVETCIGLDHQHLLGISGHVTIGDSIYSVSPWMRNGNIREHIRINPNVDRLRLLSEVASALEYLHENEIVHGDICGKNVLINGDGKAFVCGFNLSGYLRPSFDLTRARWFSPEMMTSTGLTPPTEKGDVWSFGSLGIEVFTGQDPYSSYQDYYVPILLNRGTPPADRGSTRVDMSSNMWDLLESCWQTDPTERPSMSDIHLAICEILPRGVDRQQSTFSGRDGRDRDSAFTMESASTHGSDRGRSSVFTSSVYRSSLATFVSADD